MAKEVMKNHDLVFCSRPAMVGQRKLSYNDLDIALAPYRNEWREMRKICVLHLLNTKRVQSFRQVREDEVSRMVGKITSSELANVTEIVLSFSLTVICRIAFGKRYDEEDHQSRRFIQLLHEAQAAFVGFYFSDFFPSIGWFDYLSGSFSRLDRVFQEFDSFYQELIDEHMDPDWLNSMDGDIVDLMLEIRRGNSVNSSLDITMEHIKAMLMLSLFYKL